MTFKQWLEAIQADIGDITDVLADADMLGALRLWHRRGWEPGDAVAAIQDADIGLPLRAF